MKREEPEARIPHLWVFEFWPLAPRLSALFELSIINKSIAKRRILSYSIDGFKRNSR